jgi:Rrf2 family protein
MQTTLFSAKAEYACIAMLELAARYHDLQPVPLKAIHETHGISDRFLVQILLQLKGAGLVLSTRGATGGYQLAKPPDQISLSAIINVIDRTDRSAKKTLGRDSVIPTVLVQTIRGVWKEIADAQQQALEETSLADLVRQSQESFALTYQI